MRKIIRYISINVHEKDDMKNNFANIVMEKVKGIRNKTKCFDLFHGVKVNGERMYRHQPINKIVWYRVKKKKL